MKSSLLVCSILGFIAVSLHAGPQSSNDEQRPFTELNRLREEYGRRRAEALRPVEGWYRAQLQVLQRSVSEQPQETQVAVARALASARENFWQRDQPELSKALLAGPWLWRSVDDADGVTMTFQADGTVQHVGMQGAWRITGPCEVTITNEAEERFVLRFNASLSAYEADRKSVSGHRIGERSE